MLLWDYIQNIGGKKAMIISPICILELYIHTQFLFLGAWFFKLLIKKLFFQSSGTLIGLISGDLGHKKGLLL